MRGSATRSLDLDSSSALRRLLERTATRFTMFLDLLRVDDHGDETRSLHSVGHGVEPVASDHRHTRWMTAVSDAASCALGRAIAERCSTVGPASYFPRK